MVIQDHGATVPDSLGVRMNLDLSKFGLLDFNKAQEIYNIGYNHTFALIDSIKDRIPARISSTSRAIARNSFKSKTPKIVFDNATVIGTNNAQQNEYIKHLFKNKKNSTFDIKEAKISYYHAVSSQKIKDLVPTAIFNDTTQMFTLNLNATPKDNYYVGIGGYLTSSTNSMMYLDARYSTLNLNSFDISLRAWLGQSYNAGELNAQFSLRTGIPSHIGVSAVTSKQKFYGSDKLFYSDQLSSFVINYDNHIRLIYAMALGRKAKLDVSVGYGELKDYFYQSNILDFTSSDQDKAIYKLGQAKIGVERNSFNNPLYPTDGNRLLFKAMGFTGNHSFTPTHNEIDITSHSKHLTWVQAEVDFENYFNLSPRFSLGARLNTVVSTKHLLENYTANIVQAPAFSPTPSTKNYFNPAFRANSYVATGVVPIIKISDKFQFRTEFYAFAPFREIIENANLKSEYGQWFHKLYYMGEASLVYNLSFASFCIYGNYLSHPSNNWNFGVSFGLPFIAPKFLK